MGKKKPIDPETKARWARERRELEEFVGRRLAETRAIREREARRRARLRRLSLGLLGR